MRREYNQCFSNFELLKIEPNLFKVVSHRAKPDNTVNNPKIEKTLNKKLLFLTTMKNILIILFTLFSLSIYSQAHVGVSGAMDIENDISKLGVGVNYMILPKVTLGAGLMITPFDIDGDYEIMYNVKYNLGRFNVAAGVMSEMGKMNHMGMHSSKMHSEPYFGIDFKLFKNRKLKIFYNQSEMMKTIGIMVPILNIGKKMKMNHH